MENRKKAPEGMYTAKEAIATIGISSTEFYTLVNQGEIKKVTPPHRKEGFYSKAEIDNYARNWKAFHQPYAGDKVDFGLALVEDLPSIRALVAGVSGGFPHSVPEDVLKAWIRKNPQSVHILRRGPEIVGYISMFPLPKETLMLRLSGKLLNRTIPVDDILPFAPNTAISLYIAEMAVKHAPESIKNNEPDPEHPDQAARQLGARLLREAGRFVTDLKRQNTLVTQLYAVGTSPFGIQMSRDLGMEPMDLPEGVREDRIPFQLDLQHARSVFVRRLIQGR